ncbi:DoxX family protein [Chitinophaga sp.]|uniref:DoxX family protein n=1 Tax=Chitinophaga sp. TaxID=1869181 RepID=UPI0031D7D7DB
MKKNKIIFWIATIIIVLWDGVMPGLTSHTPLAVEAIRKLGYPDYFRVMLTVFKVLGAIILVLPFAPARLKEWAYAGFGISLICASASNAVVYGFGSLAIFPLVIMAILIVSYIYYHKLLNAGAFNRGRGRVVSGGFGNTSAALQ